MVRRRNQDAIESRKLRNENEGSDLFTGFFKSDNIFNENPTKGYQQFMNNYAMDFQQGRLKRVK